MATLRSWNRRYGIGPSLHQPGRHRRYDAADVARLELMCTLVAKGVSPSDAASWVMQTPSGSPPSLPQDPGPVPPRLIAGLVKAAFRLDGLTLGDGISRQLSARGLESTWNDVCLPLIDRVGRQSDDDQYIEVEHLLSWTISVALHRIPEPRQRPGARVALLACGPDERHTLGLDALRAGLAERGIAARMLGAATPDNALVAAARQISPSVVVIWSQVAGTAHVETLRALSAALPSDTVVVAAGPGWLGRRRLPAGVVTAQALREAMLLTVGATASPPGPPSGSRTVRAVAIAAQNVAKSVR